MTHLSALSLALNRPGAVSLEQVVASLFASGEQGAWYDPSAANVTWRRNLLTYTEQFDNAAWTKTGIKAFGSGSTANAIVAPDGTTTADLITQDASTGQHKAQTATQTLPSTGEPFVVSCYAKAGTANRICLYTYGTSKGLGVDLSTGQQFTVVGLTNVLPANVFIQAVPNYAGWYRIGFKDVMVGSFSVAVFIVGGSNNENFSYTGDDSSGLYVWGTQLERGEVATAYQRIVTPELTYLADVQAQPLLWQDHYGGVPVTGVEQPVGLLLDRRKGATLGAELVDTANTASAWVASSTATVAQDGDAVKITGTGYGQINLNAAGGVSADLLPSTFYRCSFEIKVSSGATLIQPYMITTTTSEPAPIITSTTYVTRTFYFSTTAAPNNTGVALRVANVDGTDEVWIRNISVRLLDGNHAYQTGSTARPVLRARYNLLTYSEQFNVTAAYTVSGLSIAANSIAAPDGTTTADLATATAGAGRHQIRQGNTSTNNATHTVSVYVKAGTHNFVHLSFYTGGLTYFTAIYDLSLGQVTQTAANLATYSAATITAVPNASGWYRCTLTGNFTSSDLGNASFGFAGSSTGNTLDSSGIPTFTATGAETVYLWGADLRVGTSAGDYQRIAAATDYATVSTITGQAFRPYLEFPSVGNDDFLQTASIDFTGTDEMTVGVAINKTSDGSQGTVCELSTSSANAGSFGVLAPWSSGPSGNYTFRSTGSVTFSDASAGGYAAPSTNVVVGLGDISLDQSVLRVNKTQVATSATDQGSGNYTNSVLYIGRRAGTSNHLFGNIYGLVIRGKTSSAGEIASLETYLAGKAGLTL